MDFIARNIGALAKGSAVLIVFIVSISIPVITSISLQEKAKDAVIKSELSQIRNWAQIYIIKNGSYEGLAKDLEIRRVVEHIYTQGGNCVIFSNQNKYCVKTTFNDVKRGTLCIDSSGYNNNQAPGCNSNSSPICQ